MDFLRSPFQIEEKVHFGQFSSICFLLLEIKKTHGTTVITVFL
ncbi:hypothetical protein K710_2056 [Streptococcus iniae SF1]|nr:hypothetical protein K710_2056 [Streptococcus iniae SF1]EKB53130.1 hypothetical protein A0G_0965 [Streptococcus iniae 9117]